MAKLPKNLCFPMAKLPKKSLLYYGKIAKKSLLSYGKIAKKSFLCLDFFQLLFVFLQEKNQNGKVAI